MRFVIRYQKLGPNTVVKRGEVTSISASNLIKTLGEKGYYIIHYYEKHESPCAVLIIPTTRRQLNGKAK
jgi:hypothetical protein